jgi:hypothetical protein
LSFVTATGPAETHDDGISGAFRFRVPRERGIASRQILEVIEANASEARRAWGLHHQQIAGSATPMATPLRVQWPDDYQFRSASFSFRQALTLFLGKLWR